MMSPRSALVLVAATCHGKRSRWVEVIEQTGHRVFEAVDGVHALAMATRYIPDIIVADLVLSKLDGLQLRTRVASNRDLRDIPTILIGEAASDLQSHDEAHPIVQSDDDLLPHVHRLIGGRTAHSESLRTLRRAMADIRSAAQDGCDDAATLSDRARHIATGTDEAMISVLVANDDARYVEANSAICALTGYSRDELLAMSIWDLSAEELVDRGRRAWKRFLREGRFEGSYRIRRSTGEHVTTRCSSAANVVPGLHVSTMAPPRLLQVLRT